MREDDDAMIDHYIEYNMAVYDLKKRVSFYRDKIGLEMKQNKRKK